MVLQNFSLRIEKGDFAVLTGPNGSGKTTVLKLALNQLHPTDGEISLLGTPLHTFRDWTKIGYVSQNPLRDRNVPVTVEEIVSMGRIARTGIGRFLGKSDNAAVAKAISAMKIDALKHKVISNLSGGQQQRALVARALAAEAELLILDEPTSGIDVETKNELYHILDTLRKKCGVTIILVSHDVEYVTPYATSIASIEKGALRQILPLCEKNRRLQDGVVQYA
jgi:zinc transport system ATP-binding protein